MTRFHPFLIALQFLTRFPVRLKDSPTAANVGRSLLYYPLIGLILGLPLALIHHVTADAPPMLRGALLLAAWAGVTGALHLDGLADSADAWVGAAGDRTRALAIMKDPYCGPAAVVTLVVVLLIKFAALSSFPAGDWLALALIPALARSVIPLLFLTTPYVRAGGLGALMARHPSAVTAVAPVTATGIVTLAVARMEGAALLLVLGGVFLLLRRAMVRRLQGTTGDTAGALIEISETAMLVAAVLI